MEDHEINQVISPFFRAEARLFDSSIGDFPKINPQLAKYVSDYRMRIENPLVRLATFYDNNLSILKKQVQDQREQVDNLRRIARDLSAPVESIDRYVKPEEDTLRSLSQVLIDCNRCHSDFEETYVRVVQRIVQKVAQRPEGISQPNFDLDQVRNGIYRSCLTKDKSYLLGWDIKTLLKLMKINAETFTRLRDLYQSHTEEQNGIQDELVTVIFPQPLGEDQVKAETIYGKNAPTQASVSDFEALEKLVTGHFYRRTEAIFS